ncbi:MAG: LysM peptidoglycan-binding domain-containing protein [Deltaproteobacteria bacterium]|nr:LysM peptidoglycan-binding domain-containing protein [Deltaproteobacteria bacterium]
MVKIAEVPLNIMQVLNLLGLDGLTLIYDSSSDAVASFRRQQARDERAEGEEEIVPSGGQIPAERPPKAQSRAPLFLSGAALLLALVLLVLFAAMETGPSTAVDVGPVREKLALLEQRLVRLETQRQEAPRVLQKVEGLSRDLSERVASVARDLDQIREEIRSMSGKMVRAGDGGSGPERPSLRYHRVQRGESLYRIARRYGTSVAELCRLNRIQTNKVIYPGQRLVVGEDS